MKILLNILTHGDEKIGLAVAQEIQKCKIKKEVLTIHPANQKAYKAGKRYIDQDLNRSFPGKPNGNHEEQLAYSIAPMVRASDVVIDIHSTTSTLKDAVIVTKLNAKTMQYIHAIQPKYVLRMHATKNNALISEAKIGIAFEYGSDTDTHVLRNIVADLKRLFHHLGVLQHPSKRKRRKTQYFTVFAEVQKSKNATLLSHVKNYQRIRKGEAFAREGKTLLRADQDFYPILFGQKNYENIFGFMAKKEKYTFDA